MAAVTDGAAASGPSGRRNVPVRGTSPRRASPSMTTASDVTVIPKRDAASVRSLTNVVLRTLETVPVAAYWTSAICRSFFNGKDRSIAARARPSARSTGRFAFCKKPKGSSSSSARVAVTVASVLSAISACAGFTEVSGTSKREPASWMAPPRGERTCPSSTLTTKRLPSSSARPTPFVIGGRVFMNRTVASSNSHPTRK